MAISCAGCALEFFFFLSHISFIFSLSWPMTATLPFANPCTTGPSWAAHLVSTWQQLPGPVGFSVCSCTLTIRFHKLSAKAMLWRSSSVKSPRFSSSPAETPAWGRLGLRWLVSSQHLFVLFSVCCPTRRSSGPCWGSPLSKDGTNPLHVPPSPGCVLSVNQHGHVFLPEAFLHVLPISAHGGGCCLLGDTSNSESTHLQHEEPGAQECH